jgi:hypothetical protein
MKLNKAINIQKVLDAIEGFKEMPLLNKLAWESALNCVQTFVELQQRLQLTLTVEELQQMNGTPVFVKSLRNGDTFWMLAYPDQVCHRLGWLDYHTYGTEWIAYLYEFEEEV